MRHDTDEMSEHVGAIADEVRESESFRDLALLLAMEHEGDRPGLHAGPRPPIVMVKPRERLPLPRRARLAHDPDAATEALHELSEPVESADDRRALHGVGNGRSDERRVVFTGLATTLDHVAEIDAESNRRRRLLGHARSLSSHVNSWRRPSPARSGAAAIANTSCRPRDVRSSNISCRRSRGRRS